MKLLNLIVCSLPAVGFLSTTTTLCLFATTTNAWVLTHSTPTASVRINAPTSSLALKQFSTTSKSCERPALISSSSLSSKSRTATTTTTTTTSTTTTQLHESFGSEFAEDSYANQAEFLRGEAEYKQWINRIDSNNMLNRKYNVIGRVRELNLLQATVDAGVLSKLDANGVDLVALEQLLPLADQLGVLSVLGNNQQLLINGLAPVLIEGAPLLLPVLTSALSIGPPAFFGTAAVCFGLEAYLVSTQATLPLVGLDAGLFLGLLLVPLGTIAGGLGVALASTRKKK